MYIVILSSSALTLYSISLVSYRIVGSKMRHESFGRLLQCLLFGSEPALLQLPYSEHIRKHIALNRFARAIQTL